MDKQIDNGRKKFKVGDRVNITRSDIAGPLGTVQQIRVETTRSTIKQDSQEAPAVTVTVLWDNGTVSHFVPEGLERVS